MARRSVVAFLDVFRAPDAGGQGLRQVRRTGTFDVAVSRLSYTTRADARDAAGELRVNAIANSLGGARKREDAAIRLSDAGLAALLPTQQFGDPNAAVLTLLVALESEPTLVAT